MDAVKTEFGPGDIIADRYKVQREIGRGGMGMVYLVEDLNTHDPLALKTLLPQYTKNGFAIRRFVREVNAVRKLRHPAIVRIHDAQRMGNLIFYTMDYIEGKSLRSLLKRRGRLGLNSTVRIMALLADALEHAHQHTIHRDLSPENIMVLGDGSIRLLDFGLAKLSDNKGSFTQIGISLGKMQYNAPEQRVNATDVDHRADIYSMGVMFYEMLAGKHPDPGEKLTDFVPELPEEANAFVEKAMAALPEYRFSSAREFRQELMRIYKISQGEPVPPPPPEPQVQTPPTSAAATAEQKSTPRRRGIRTFFRRVLARFKK